MITTWHGTYDGLGPWFRFSYIYACIAVFLCCCRFLVNKDYILRVRKKQDTKLLPVTFPNVNRFSTFFHCQTQ